jgi:hypothetical protein
LPEIADQFSVGYFRNFRQNTYETSLEIYYKDLQNQIEYRDGANVMFSSAIESEYVYGMGNAYGVELYIRKKTGRLTGWFAYTWGKTNREFPQINQGKKFPARYNRDHDFSIVAVYKLTDRLSVSGTYIYYSGNSVTFPSGKYSVKNIIVPYYTERNAYKMPDYHRLDLSFTLEGKKHHRYSSSWNLSIFNAYARQNPNLIIFKQDENNPERTIAVQQSYFSIVPALTYNFNF